MKSKSFKLCILFMFFYHTYLPAQDSKKGVIVDSENMPIEGVVIAHLDSVSDKLISTILTDSLGVFEFKSVKNSFLYVHHIGYKSQKITDMREPLTMIMLEPNTIVLDEVVIKAERPSLTLKNDRIVYDMSSNPLKKDNLLEALKFVPLISANGESFSIIGKARTEIYINDRKSSLKGEALTAYLKSLPADNIKNIEIITNPNSTYRGEGNFGILNIQLKKNETEGLRGTFSGQIWKTHYFKEQGSVNLEYQKNKIAANISVGATNTSDWKENSVESVYKQDQTKTSTNTVTDGDNQGYFVNLIADYKLSNKESLGIIVNTSTNKGDWSETGNTSFGRVMSSMVDSITSIDYHSKMNTNEVAANLNYRKNFTSNHYFFIDMDYLNNQSQLEFQNKMNHLDKDGNYLSPYKKFQQIAPQKTSIWSGKAEYGYKFKNAFSFKTGFDSYYSTIDNDDKYNSWQENWYVEDSLQSNHFVLKEWTSALFLFGSKEWSEKISTSLGLRLEYTDYKGKQHASNDVFKNNYLKLLPNFYLNYKLSRNHNLSYNFSYRIARPPFAALNPFRIYTSPTTYTSGNPFLKPEKRLSQNLEYMLLGKYYFTATYNVTNDVVNRMKIVNEDNTIESKPLNIGTLQNFSFLFNTSKSYWNEVGKANVSLSYNWLYTKGYADNLNVNYVNQYFNANLNNYFSLSKKHNLSFDFSGNFYTKVKYAYQESPTSLDLNAQLKKRFGSWQVSLYYFKGIYFYDGKCTQIWKLSYNTDDLETITYKKGESTSFGVRFSYNFGNTKVKGAKQHNTSNSEIRSRIK